ncbi:MAG: alpha/beta fold hydrolase [Woeseiaceae bacterium]|jgi:pimeloyl-ACP methyl ester carboxylesterase|nr:alpha/beta fold hydrolase [Woeseiaceae bacterium]
MTPTNTVICIHGIWSHGVSMYLIKRRLEKEYGYDVRLFNYPSVRGSLDDNADLLSRFIEEQGLNETHIIGHSLGGVIALRMLSNSSDSVPGRLVCIGSPLVGSRAATFLSTQDWAAPFVGQSLSTGVVEKAANQWASHVCEQRDVGIIAGTSPYGFGRLITTFDGDNDGSVAVAETRLEGATDHICMDVSHKSMLVSAGVVDQAAAFLKRGEFLRDESGRG